METGANKPMAQANACLIAAAPELLAACEALVATDQTGPGIMIPCYFCNLSVGHETRCPVGQAYVALAKAGGTRSKR
jgi:hypothetical protein